VYEIRQRFARVRKDERGYTLQEVLTVGTIAAAIFLVLLERCRVDAATKQLVGDLRLAHGSATNQITDWRVVLASTGRKRRRGQTTTWSGLPNRTGPVAPGRRPTGASSART
jgi:Tfp pilus assembly protein FimT